MRRRYFLIVLGLFLNIALGTAATPRRIVSLAPSLTRCLYQLGVDDRVVGCTSYCLTAGRAGVTVVASAVRVSPEAVAKLSPDLVLVSSLTGQRDVETLKRLGLNVVRYPVGATFEEICDQLMDLGKRVGRVEQARNLTKDACARVQSVRSGMKTQGLTGRSILMQLGDDPLYGVTEGNYMAEMISQLGGVNICGDLKGGAISREFVLKSDPDYIFVIGMGEDRMPMIKHWQEFPAMKAVKRHHLCELDADMVSQPTPTTYAEALAQMARTMGLRSE